jgi:hypothetical protein
MLKKLQRKKTQKKIWIILAILIVPAFILWGSGSIIRNKEESSDVGIIFGKRITPLEFKDALDATRNLAILHYGGEFEKMQKALDLESQAWERLILLTEAKKRKINISDKEIVDFIENLPFFKGKNGRFDQRLYSQILRYDFYNTQPRTFEEQVRQNLIISKLFLEVTGGIKISEQQIRDEYRKVNEKISINYIASYPADFIKDVLVEESKIKDYFSKNSLQFKQPLSFNIEYISLSLEDKDKIKKLSLRLKKKTDFLKLAKEFGLTLKETGLFRENDPIPGIGWAPQITSLISKMNAGQYLKPLLLERNYYILKIKERKEPYIPDFENIKDKVRQAYLKDKSQEIAKEKIESCLKKLKELYNANPKTLNLESTAKLFGLKSGSTDLFQYGGYIEGIGASDNFWTQAEDLRDGGFSEVINMPSGFYIFNLKSRIPIDEKQFAGDKEAFAQKILTQKKEESFAKFVEDLKKGTQRF